MDAPAATAQVQVLMNPRDDVHVTKALLERHDPARGLVVVHPTPGTWAPAAFGHDLLAAFGRAVNRLGEENLVSTARACSTGPHIAVRAGDDLMTRAGHCHRSSVRRGGDT